MNGEMPEVGAIMVSTNGLPDCQLNEKAVVYDRYTRSDWDDPVGISLIFENGFYDGFSRLANYQYKGVFQLCEDYECGVFDVGFKA